MNRLVKTNMYLTAVVAACLFSQTVSLADEMRSSSVSTETPLGSASTKVSSRTNASGSSTVIKKEASGLGAAASNTIKAETGPDGATISKEDASVQDNGDGSVSANKTEESHTMTNAGSAHQKVKSSTTVGSDGSSATVKQSAKTTISP